LTPLAAGWASGPCDDRVTAAASCAAAGSSETLAITCSGRGGWDGTVSGRRMRRPGTASRVLGAEPPPRTSTRTHRLIGVRVGLDLGPPRIPPPVAQLFVARDADQSLLGRGDCLASPRVRPASRGRPRRVVDKVARNRGPLAVEVDPSAGLASVLTTEGGQSASTGDRCDWNRPIRTTYPPRDRSQPRRARRA
jgi:hypothetical protein